jgi:hypothetical protein
MKDGNLTILYTKETRELLACSLRECRELFTSLASRAE